MVQYNAIPNIRQSLVGRGAMRRNLGRLFIDEIIIHQVPGRSKVRGQPLVLSETVSPLSLEVKNYFEEKIRGSLASAAYHVCFDPCPDPPTPVPALVLDHLGGQFEDFVTISQRLAEHLYTCQTGATSDGLLSAVQGKIEGIRCLVIMKLENEVGVRVEQIFPAGQRTFSVEHVRGLMLTERTKIFKTGLFVQEGATIEDIEGAVSDNQRGFRPTVEVANFFLKNFLGCRLCEAAEITTKNFYLRTESFINEEAVDPAVKARYQIALLAELGRASDIVQPASFTQQYMDLEDRSRYLEFLAAEGIPTEQFPKDTKLVEKQLQRLQVDFASGLALLGPPDAMKEHVTFSMQDNEATRVTIHDRVKRMHGR